MKSDETLGIGGFFTLHLSDFHKVFEAFFYGFNMPEHHGRTGGQSQLMGSPHDIQPLIAQAFSGADDFSYPVDEDFRTGTG